MVVTRRMMEGHVTVLHLDRRIGKDEIDDARPGLHFSLRNQADPTFSAVRRAVFRETAAWDSRNTP